MYERHPTAQLINHNEQLYLLDCGEGTQMQLAKYGVKSNRISRIFISHLHGDHYLGLTGLLSSMHLMGRKTELHLHGPAPLKEILEVNFKYSETKLSYPLAFHPTNPDIPEVIFDTKQFSVHTFPLQHRIPCTGFRFQEGQRPAKLNYEKTQAVNVPPTLLNGIKWGLGYEDIQGKVYSHEELTFPAPKSRSYGYCSDTVMNTSYFPYIEQVDLLYHESTFLDAMSDRAKETFHTTALQAGEVAKAVQAGELLLGHYSARYKTKELPLLLEEAKKSFENTELSVEGKWYKVGLEN